MAEFYIAPVAVNKIINNPYYHLKHYGELPHHETDYYLMKLKYAEEESKQKLIDIIKLQKKKEEEKLRPIFQHRLYQSSLISLGYSQSAAKQLVDSFNNGKNGGIQEKIQFLNFLDNFSLYSETKENDNPFDDLISVINQSFSNITPISKKYSNIENQEIFISSLIAIFNSLSNYLNQHSKDKVIRGMIEAPLKKIKYLIEYQKSEYQKKLNKRQQEAKNFDAFFNDLQYYADIPKGRRWSKLLEANQNYDVVKAVLQDSARGFLIQHGGKTYEESVKNHLLSQIESVFKGMKIEVSEKEGKVIGGNTDTFKTQQKADISLTFSLSGKTNITEKDYNLTFSLKKSKESSSSIQIHHGGSLFAYANRLSNYDNNLDFLNDGDFQYVYVNEFQKNNFGGEFVEGFKSALNSFGFYFLGQEIEGFKGGADFLYISGKLYAFSTILEQALQDPNIFQTSIKFIQKDPLSQKIKMMEGEFKNGYQGEYYSDAFIEKSIDIGKQAIYGTTFTLNLKKSSLNL